MREEPVDPRIDRMMAALYGELSESEERAFLRLLEKDDALRAEWDELRESRKLLADWKVEESVPSFVLVEGEHAPARTKSGGWLERLRDSLRNLGPVPTWGLATAAVAALAFFLADARFDRRLERELAAIRSVAPAPETVRDRLADLDPGKAIESVATTTPGPAETRGRGSIVPVSSNGSFVTHEDLDAYNQELMTSLVALLNEYDARRAEDVSGLVQSLYERVNNQQLYDYRQVHDRIDALGAELLFQENRHEQTLDELLGPARKGRQGNPAPTNETEE